MYHAPSTGKMEQLDAVLLYRIPMIKEMLMLSELNMYLNHLIKQTHQTAHCWWFPFPHSSIQRQNKTFLSSAQWQEAMGTDWNTRHPKFRKRIYCLYPSTTRGSPRMTKSPHSLGCPKLYWTKPWATTSKGSQTRTSPEVPSNHCNFVILQS